MDSRLLFVVALACCAGLIQGQDVEPAPACDWDQCKLPNCRCSEVTIPGDLRSEETPQMVFLTFDDAVTTTNYPFYKEIFNPSRVNPNGHPITGTFYVAHEYSNYSMIHDLWRDGHEIALHSITHNALTTYWKELNETMWRDEVVAQREQMANFARIPVSDIKGFRAPFLQGGGDRMYDVLAQAKFQYECSRPTLSFRNPGLWPYTNDYLSTQDCQIDPCPVGSYPGFWTVPMIDLIGDNDEGCSMVDTCTPVPETEADTYSLLMRNFMDHYNGTRAPFGIYAHAGWVNGTGDGDEVEQRRAGYERFIDTVLTYGDVYIVSVTRGIEWVKSPQSMSTVNDFPAFKVEQKPDMCPRNYVCYYKPEQTPFPTERYMHSCVNCPPTYPWIHNNLGRG